MLYHGPVWRWYRDGQRESKENYVYGAADGDTPSWYENGKMSSHGAFKNGSKAGLWKYWDELGRIATEVTYGESGNRRTDYYPSGQKRATGVFVSSGKIGKWVYWDDNGKEQATCDFGTGVFTVTTRPCQVIAKELGPEGFSRPIPVGSLKADGSCLLRVANQTYSFVTPSGWAADAETGRKEGAPLVFNPVGGSWRGNNPNLYVRVIFKDGASFEAVQDRESEGFQENVAEYSEVGVTKGKLKNGSAVVTRTITYKGVVATDSPFSVVADNFVYESLTFIDASEEVVLLAVLTSVTEKGHAASRSALAALVQSTRVSTK